ncbi:dickkopf-related protein 4 [Anolis carolinensis]|uniref:dickkopf-related protein 4 n=1 Tax=Anolis carolinensis TaxID=28377 RepID=UPI002F2B7058
MEALILLGFTCLCCPGATLVLDFNAIRGSTEVPASRKSSQCLADKDCPAGKFCHRPREEPPVCAVCRGPRRRCQRSPMCCPGMLCVNDVCTASDRMAVAGGQKKSTEPLRPDPLSTAGPALKEGDTQSPPGEAPEGKSCLRSSDCAGGQCCARHFWTKVCKPVLSEGQVCSKRGQKEGAQGPEIFQRCNCGPGLSCRLLLGAAPKPSRLRVCQRRADKPRSAW